MPNRILKESICVSDTIDKLTWFEEVLFYRLIVNCDDFGRFDGRPAVIKNRLFPLKDSITLRSVSDAINTLSSMGLVTLYVFEGKPYLYLTSWYEHQNKRATKSKYPDPENADGKQLQTSEINCKQLYADEINCNQLQANAPDIRIRNSIFGTRNTRTINAPAPAKDEGLSEIMSFYEDNISKAVPSSVTAASIRDYTERLGSDIVIHALTKAAEAEAHDWRYAKRILDRYIDQGLATLEDVITEESRFQAQKNVGKNKRQKQYANNTSSQETIDYLERLEQSMTNDEETLEQMARIRKKMRGDSE